MRFFGFLSPGKTSRNPCSLGQKSKTTLFFCSYAFSAAATFKWTQIFLRTLHGLSRFRSRVGVVFSSQPGVKFSTGRSISPKVSLTKISCFVLFFILNLGQKSPSQVNRTEQIASGVHQMTSLIHKIASMIHKIIPTVHKIHQIF